jgi:hypothetical protein
MLYSYSYSFTFVTLKHQCQHVALHSVKTSGVPRGGWGLGCLTPPRNSEGPPKNHAKLNPIVKTVLKKC